MHIQRDAECLRYLRSCAEMVKMRVRQQHGKRVQLCRTNLRHDILRLGTGVDDDGVFFFVGDQKAVCLQLSDRQLHYMHHM